MSHHPQLTGLTAREVEESRRLHGANLLTPPEKTPLWRQFLEKFRDPLIVILMVAACLSIGIACYEYGFLDEGSTVFFEPVGIVVAILLATGLAFIFEHKAENEFAILNQVNDDEPVEVVRDATATKIPKRDVVVGDILLLETGQEVPADAELLDAVSMKVDESTLTGEPICDKSADTSVQDPEATFPTNHVMRGTKVMEGHGVARVFAVGDHTENGRVYVAAQIDDSVKTPLSEQLDGLGRWVSNMSYAIAALVVVGRMLAYLHGVESPDLAHLVAYTLQTVMIAVTLIVVAVPEGLPMAVTLALAYSMRRMLKTHNLVRRLHACETMGATTVICTDKTGTLTQNQMRVVEATDASQRLLENCALNSTAQLDLSHPEHPTVLGNPTEGALLLWLREQGCDYLALRRSATRLSEVPFSTERKWMATLAVDAADHTVLYVKGAPEVVMALCGETDRREALEERLACWQSQATRTLAFASAEVAPGEQPIADDGTLRATRLDFLGIVAISDPVRDDVPQAVQQCVSAGIDVKMVTGDNLVTAREIGREIGLWTEDDGPQALITGTELAALSDEELSERVLQLKIVARARPLDKKRLVEALQKRGQVVAVTGDGTNDAPALKAAHVGLSMGDGTSVAKEASDITIIDNSFASIGRAVMWGRSLYQNIQRFLIFQLTVNVAACLLVLSGAFMGTESPLTVTQMLWVNLIMDTFGAMALSSLPPTPSVMGRPPRRREDFILDRDMRANILGVGCFFFVLLLAFLYVFQHADVRCMADLLRQDVYAQVVQRQPSPLTPYEQTLLFSIFVWTHFWYMFNARAFRSGGSGFDLKGCRGFGTIVTVIVVGQLLIVEAFPAFFNVVPLCWQDWLTVVLLSSLVLWVREAFSLLRRRYTMMNRLPAAQGIIPMLLLAVTGCTDPQEAREMRLLMEQADSMNRNYVPFTTDTVARRVAGWYDRHGTANERVRAHYLLGCAWADLGLLPRALDEFHLAAEQADTTHIDSVGYHYLSRVYGQMGDLLYNQQLPRNALNAYEKAYHYAQLGKEPWAAAAFYAQESACYYDLCLLDSAIYSNKKAFSLLQAAGDTLSANICLGALAYNEMQRGIFTNVKDYLLEFQNHSHLNEETLQAYDNWKLLYYYWGYYYLKTGVSDSALYYFYKEEKCSNNPNNRLLAYKGLYQTYDFLNKPDSTRKYAELYAEMEDSTNRLATSTTLLNIHHLYDYNRYLSLANHKTVLANRANRRASILAIAIILVLFAAAIVIMRIRHRNAQRIASLSSQYVFALMEYQRLKTALRNKEGQNDSLQKRLEQVETQLAEMHEDKKRPEEWDLDDTVLSAPIIIDLHALAAKSRRASDDEWRELEEFTTQEMPEFIATIQRKNLQVRSKEYYACLLIRLRFSLAEICCLLDVSSQTLNTMRRRMHQKFFGIAGGAREFDEKIRQI